MLKPLLLASLLSVAVGAAIASPTSDVPSNASKPTEKAQDVIEYRVELKRVVAETIRSQGLTLPATTNMSSSATLVTPSTSDDVEKNKGMIVVTQDIPYIQNVSVTTKKDGSSEKKVTPGVLTTGVTLGFTSKPAKNGQLLLSYQFENIDAKPFEATQIGGPETHSLSKKSDLYVSIGKSETVNFGEGFTMTVTAVKTLSANVPSKIATTDIGRSNQFVQNLP